MKASKKTSWTLNASGIVVSSNDPTPSFDSKIWLFTSVSHCSQMIHVKQQPERCTLGAPIVLSLLFQVLVALENTLGANVRPNSVFTEMSIQTASEAMRTQARNAEQRRSLQAGIESSLGDSGIAQAQTLERRHDGTRWCDCDCH